MSQPYAVFNGRTWESSDRYWILTLISQIATALAAAPALLDAFESWLHEVGSLASSKATTQCLQFSLCRPTSISPDGHA